MTTPGHPPASAARPGPRRAGCLPRRVPPAVVVWSFHLVVAFRGSPSTTLVPFVGQSVLPVEIRQILPRCPAWFRSEPISSPERCMILTRTAKCDQRSRQSRVGEGHSRDFVRGIHASQRHLLGSDQATRRPLPPQDQRSPTWPDVHCSVTIRSALEVGDNWSPSASLEPACGPDCETWNRVVPRVLTLDDPDPGRKSIQTDVRHQSR